ncbi:uncharacterized protein Dmoj_GI25605, partial [Drosophila mojavensis]
NFTIYRLDRAMRRGGGVLIADAEIIWVKLTLPSCSLFITCSYIPPSTD